MNGLHIPNNAHNIHNLADNPQGNTTNGQAWDYKYQVTNAENETTFMRLHPTWQQANNHPENL